MHQCPVCKMASVPKWRAWVMSPLFAKPFACATCSTPLVLRPRPADILCAMLPQAMTSFVAFKYEAQPVPFVLYAFGLSAVTGMSLWAHSIRYVPVEQPEKFKPHTNRLDF